MKDMATSKPRSITPPNTYHNQIATKADLQEFKNELVLTLLMALKPYFQTSSTKWLKSHQVRKILGISNGTLHSMRVNGIIPYTKIGNIIYYDQDEINAVVKANKHKSGNHEDLATLDHKYVPKNRKF